MLYFTFFWIIYLIISNDLSAQKTDFNTQLKIVGYKPDFHQRIKQDETIQYLKIAQQYRIILQEPEKSNLFYKYILKSIPIEDSILLAKIYYDMAENFHVMQDFLLRDQYLDSAIFFSRKNINLHTHFSLKQIENDLLRGKKISLDELKLIQQFNVTALNDSIILTSKYAMLALYYYQQKNNYDSAYFYYQLSYRYSAYELIRKQQIGDVFIAFLEANNRVQNAYYILKKNYQHQLTINQHFNARNYNDLLVRYQSVLKDKKIQSQQYTLNKQLSKTRVRNLIITTLIIFSISLLLFLILYRQQQKKKILQLENNVLKAQLEGSEQERKRIAKELHDGVGGLVYAAKMQYHKLLHEYIDDSKIQEGKELLNHIYEELRTISHNLSSDLFNQEGLVKAIQYYLNSFQQAHIQLHFEHYNINEHKISKDLCLNLFRLVQEIVLNVIKHSQATKTQIILQQQQKLFYITIEDNGKGIINKEQNNGIGLLNLYERIELFKGTLEIDSRLDKGTTFYIQFPI